ncbi:MAG TPA: MFS transporter, partial [Desulfobacterales bacterium]|nr:MFS transporter [Desulfobacterales bacterium]
MNLDHSPPQKAAWFVWGLGALFYLMGFFHRVAPAVMTEELMREFNINATALGNLSAFYFYSYVAMQIPTGILSDTLGPRRLLTIGSLVAGIGTLIFALSSHIIWADFGRLLIGGSVAVAFVGLLKVANNWFHPRHYAMISGLALFFGIVGAVFAGTPLRLLMNYYSWRTVILLSALITFVICLNIWFFVRDYPHEKGYMDIGDTGIPTGKKSLKNIVQGVLEVFNYPNTWFLFVIPGGLVGCVLTFSGLWGVPFLTTHHELSPPVAAAMTSTLLVAWAVGGPFFGWLSDRLGHRKRLYLIGSIISIAGWLSIIFITKIPIYVLVTMLLVTGFSSGCIIITFAFAKESVPADLSGTVSGVVNMGVMMGPMLLQPAVGWILDLKWQGEVIKGIRFYSLDAYQTGFSLMIAWAVLSFFLL